MPGAAVGVVLAAAGYPDAPARGDAIEGLDDAAAGGALVFHAGTGRDDDGDVARPAGGSSRSSAAGADLDAARARPQTAADGSPCRACSGGTTSAGGGAAAAGAVR